MKLEHQVNDKGQHRIVANGDLTGTYWTPYDHIAVLKHKGKTYIATTAYYEGTLPTYKVMEVTEVAGKA